MRLGAVLILKPRRKAALRKAAAFSGYAVSGSQGPVPPRGWGELDVFPKPSGVSKYITSEARDLAEMMYQRTYFVFVENVMQKRTTERSARVN